MGNFTPVKLGPFVGGMRNSSGQGENIKDDEVFDLVNLEVDLDGTLVNRPAIKLLVPGYTTVKVLGKFLPDNGNSFLVVTYAGVVRLLNATTGALVSTSSALTCVTVIQYSNKLWVIPAPSSAGNGGYFDGSVGVPTWTAVAAIPKGESCCLYKERIFVGCGPSSTSNTARVRYCAVGDPLTWSGTDNFDVSPGDGEKLVDVVSVANDIIIFKEHSTWRYNYSKLPAQAEITNIDRRIGVPAINCTVVYNSNTVYVLHDNAVYELFNSTYQRISAPIAMTQELDPDLYAVDTFGLTLFRDRLFVRYYAHMYVYALRTQRWSRWVTNRKFSKIVVIPTASLGLDTAYMHSAGSANPDRIYIFRDDRVTGVGDSVNGEVFSCQVVTKVYDFDLPPQYKAITHGGVDIATSGVLTTSITIPNAGQNNTWGVEEATFIWDNPGNWDDQDQLLYTTNISPALGDYARKFLRAIKQKFRFRQVYFTLTTDAVENTNGSDSSVKIYGITVYLREAQLAPKETN